MNKSGRCDGVLVQGGGGQPRRHFGGSWQGGWWSGNVDKVERWRAGLGAQPIETRSLSLLTPACSTLPLAAGVLEECGLLLRKATTTPRTLTREMV